MISGIIVATHAQWCIGVAILLFLVAAIVAHLVPMTGTPYRHVNAFTIACLGLAVFALGFIVT